ncbi:hypothetical protein B0H14DRAFT_2566233 [Mycena olivaceomarginata]|nr:hypothetical protein B0H14DRAFT_2566233 [Mycena olivaceomarginata]
MSLRSWAIALFFWTRLCQKGAALQPRKPSLTLSTLLGRTIHTQLSVQTMLRMTARGIRTPKADNPARLHRIAGTALCFAPPVHVLSNERALLGDLLNQSNTELSAARKKISRLEAEKIHLQTTLDKLESRYFTLSGETSFLENQLSSTRDAYDSQSVIWQQQVSRRRAGLADTTQL